MSSSSKLEQLFKAAMDYYSSGRFSQHLLWLACLAGVAGLLASRALVALSPVVGVFAVLANPHLRRDGPLYFRNGAAMRAAAIVGFLLLSGLYTSDWPVWKHEVFRSLPWLAVPLAFTLAVPLTAQQRLAVGAWFVLATAAVGLATMGQYLADPGGANRAIHIGHNMQAVTGVFHISFGVMLALAFFWSLLLRRKPGVGYLLRGGLLAAAAVSALALHVLAYRTGLLVFYAVLLGGVGGLLVRRQRAWGLAALGLLVLGPWLAYLALDSIRERVASTRYDVQQFAEGRDINTYSLSRRLAAMETAGVVIRGHWLFGVAPADAHAAMREQYRWKDYGLRPANQVDVHNQYLAAWLGGGVVGLALWLAVLFWPLRRHWGRRSWGKRSAGAGVFILAQATVMLVADVLSLQIGLNLFVFGYGFLIVAVERMDPAGRTVRAKRLSMGQQPPS
jgi:O-antigen ligase